MTTPDFPLVYVRNPDTEAAKGLLLKDVPEHLRRAVNFQWRNPVLYEGPDKRAGDVYVEAGCRDAQGESNADRIVADYESLGRTVTVFDVQPKKAAKKTTKKKAASK